jgi:NADH dehydrogenase (ubiquinone) 1 alpha subcomplex subunit 5
MLLSRALRVASQSARVKLTTGITGLDVIPNAREVLIRLYEKTLTDVQVMPAEVPYRQLVEHTTNLRLEIVKKHEDVRWLWMQVPTH